MTMTPQAFFRLRITGPPGTPELLDLLPGTLTIGREEDNALILRHTMISRRHAIIECTPEGRCFITDQRSTNGTLLNGARLGPLAATPLAAGDVVAIGPFTLAVEPAPALQPAPPPPDKGAAPPTASTDGEEKLLLSGLTLHSQRLLRYLPDIYQPPADGATSGCPAFSDADFSPVRFISRFLALFESILLPIEWTVDNFDLFLDPHTAPASFLAWLASWFEITFDETWSDAQRRTLLAEAHRIYSRRGTRWALGRMLEIYTGRQPVIVDDAADQEPHTFDVILPGPNDPQRRTSIEAIIDAHKPAHTMYTLKFQS